MTTVNVTVTLLEQDSTPIEGALIKAKLQHTDIDGGYVAGTLQTFTSDVSGQAVMPLWPNALGSTESRYHVTAYHPTTRRKIVDVMATIPNNDCNLSDVAELPAYPGKPDGGIAAAQAVNYAGYAEEWANRAEDSLIPTAAGGDGVDDYSALHHSAKANAQRVLAETARTGAETAETNAASSASAASASETNAATSEANAASSASFAATSETNAAGSESAALASENKASKWAEELEDTEVEAGKYSALHHAAKASASASSASTSEANAASSASAAATSETNTASSESAAATSESNAAASASAAATSESNAATSEANASNSAAAAAASYDSFDDRYLGAKTSDPTLDNDGNALIDGALYWNSAAGELRAYNLSTTSWVGIKPVAGSIHAATSKTTPADADEIPLADSAASFSLKKLTWANLKAAIKSYYDSVAATLTNKTIDTASNTIKHTDTSTSTQYKMVVTDGVPYLEEI